MINLFKGHTQIVKIKYYKNDQNLKQIQILNLLKIMDFFYFFVISMVDAFDFGGIIKPDKYCLILRTLFAC